MNPTNAAPDKKDEDIKSLKSLIWPGVGIVALLLASAGFIYLFESGKSVAPTAAALIEKDVRLLKKRIDAHYKDGNYASLNINEVRKFAVKKEALAVKNTGPLMLADLVIADVFPNEDSKSYFFLLDGARVHTCMALATRFSDAKLQINGRTGAEACDNRRSGNILRIDFQ